MVKSIPGLDTELSGKPLIFIPDTGVQRIPANKGVQYKPPVKLEPEYFNRITDTMNRFCIRSSFEFIDKPLYEIFDNELFDGYRSFWKHVLGRKLPIYVVSSLMGIVWPGERGGTYDLPMDEVFYVWRQYELWRVTLEIYEKCGCDRVFSFLPPIYNNIVFAEGVPWYKFKPEEFIENIKLIKYIAKSAPYKQELRQPNITRRIFDKVR